MVEYIERERARREFALFFQDSERLVEDCDSLLCMLPAADVAPVVHGRWITFEHWVHKTFWKGKACSVCNANIGHKTVFKFCPNCGARMGDS